MSLVIEIDFPTVSVSVVHNVDCSATSASVRKQCFQVAHFGFNVREITNKFVGPIAAVYALLFGFYKVFSFHTTVMSAVMSFFFVMHYSQNLQWPVPPAVCYSDHTCSRDGQSDT